MVELMATTETAGLVGASSSRMVIAASAAGARIYAGSSRTVSETVSGPSILESLIVWKVKVTLFEPGGITIKLVPLFKGGLRTKSLNRLAVPERLSCTVRLLLVSPVRVKVKYWKAALFSGTDRKSTRLNSSHIPL